MTPSDSSRTAGNPTLQPQLRRLSSRDPADYVRLLWWVLVMPQQLKAYRDTFGEKDERRVGKWLSSTLIWLPLFVPTLALGLNFLPCGADTLPTGFYLGCLPGLILAWALTGWLGNIDVADGVADAAPIGRAGVAALGVVLAVVFSVAIVAAVGVTDAVTKDMVFVITVCVCIAESVAFVVADVVAKGVSTGVLGGLEGFVALGVAGFTGIGAARGVADLVANLVVVGVAARAALSVGEGVQASLKTGRPFWTARVVFGALVLVHVFLAWFSFLGCGR